MLSVLFWNLMGQRRESLCANLAQMHSVDILLLAECQKPPATVLAALNRLPGGKTIHWHRTSNAGRVEVFSRFPAPELPEIYSSQRYTVHSLVTPGVPELLLVSVHAMSALRMNELEQAEELRGLARHLVELEDARGHTRTLLVGDLNADPFDNRVQLTVGLNAIQSRAEAMKGQRRVQKADYRYFFNPMWQFHARQPPDPPGTYYRRKAEHSSRLWHLFDQALLRPALLPYFADTDIAILTGDGTTSFQKADGTPNKKVASDHFPILIKLNYPGV